MSMCTTKDSYKEYSKPNKKKKIKRLYILPVVPAHPVRKEILQVLTPSGDIFMDHEDRPSLSLFHFSRTAYL